MSGITNERTKTAIDDWMAVKDGRKSRWHELFGTPERAARTLFEIKCGEKSCKGCPIAEPCAECDVMLDDGKALHDALLEWLRSNAE